MNRITFTHDEAKGIKNIIGWLEQTNFFKHKNTDKLKAQQFFTNAKSGLDTDNSITIHEWNFIQKAYLPNKKAFESFMIEKIERLQKQQEEIVRQQLVLDGYTQMIGEMHTATGRFAAA